MRTRNVRFTLRKKTRSRVVVNISVGDVFILTTYEGDDGALYGYGKNIRQVKDK